MGALKNEKRAVNKIGERLKRKEKESGKEKKESGKKGERENVFPLCLVGDITQEIKQILSNNSKVLYLKL